MAKKNDQIINGAFGGYFPKQTGENPPKKKERVTGQKKGILSHPEPTDEKTTGKRGRPATETGKNYISVCMRVDRDIYRSVEIACATETARTGKKVYLKDFVERGLVLALAEFEDQNGKE